MSSLVSEYNIYSKGSIAEKDWKTIVLNPVHIKIIRERGGQDSQNYNLHGLSMSGNLLKQKVRYNLEHFSTNRCTGDVKYEPTFIESKDWRVYNVFNIKTSTILGGIVSSAYVSYSPIAGCEYYVAKLSTYSISWLKAAYDYYSALIAWKHDDYYHANIHDLIYAQTCGICYNKTELPISKVLTSSKDPNCTVCVICCTIQDRGVYHVNKQSLLANNVAIASSYLCI